MEFSQIATITVTYNPDMALLRAQVSALPEASPKILVDNGSHPDRIRDIEALARSVSNITLVLNGRNLGLAAALNLGASRLFGLASQVGFLLLLDQDSELTERDVDALARGFEALTLQGRRVGCVGPLLRDVETGAAHGFHQMTPWRWTRVVPSRGSMAPVPCASLNGSGTLVPSALWKELGGLDESLFIDHVDTDWSFRVSAAGYELWGIPEAVFMHRMGKSSRRIWFLGWRVWPMRSPQRHYYLFRNAIHLMGRSYVPGTWKAWAAVKLVVTIAVTSVIGPERIKQIICMSRGVRDGFGLYGRG